MLALLLAVSADPTAPPSLPPEIDEDLVTPGVVGFVVFAVIAIVVVLLVLDMVRRTRRVRYRSEIRERLEAERAAAESVGTDGPTSGSDTPPPRD